MPFRCRCLRSLLYGFWGNFACGIQRVVPSGQDGAGSQSQRAIWFILPARGASDIITRFNTQWKEKESLNFYYETFRQQKQPDKLTNQRANQLRDLIIAFKRVL